ncbi:uncharacterized protein LOC124285930 isoform X1 [Haliotis rubra]|uniref:uncharacterized protein LOC124285930 isoform X1 n=1 Tax=Haliotis rubra TaxID=36100 RepID=UPI001EE5FCE8|nr:uncharacterized protein LOC124285930 isoform X1 [Haliotis rubra]
MPSHGVTKERYRRSRSRSPYQRLRPFKTSRYTDARVKSGGRFDHSHVSQRFLSRRKFSSSPQRSPRDHRERSKHGHSPHVSNRYKSRKSPYVERKTQHSPTVWTSPVQDKPKADTSVLDRDSLRERSTSGHTSHQDYFPSENRKVKKKVTLNERFGLTEKKFELEENITIGLQRNPHIPISTAVNVTTANFDFHNFLLKRQASEGRKPIFDREEIKAFHHDDNLDDPDEFERRIITVLSPKPHGSFRGRQDLCADSTDVDYSIRRSLSTASIFDAKHDERNMKGTHQISTYHSSRDERARVSSRHEALQITRGRTSSPMREPQVRLDPRPDPRYEAKYRANEERISYKRLERVNENPNDLRHSLHRKLQDTMGETRYKTEAMHPDGHQKDEKPGHGRDAWEVANEYQRDRPHSGASESHETSAYRGKLPDFSKRVEKFSYEEWKDKPEMVPKGSSYYEHDNRDDNTFFRRGRGRGRYLGSRSRGTTRGFFQRTAYQQTYQTPYSKNKQMSVGQRYRGKQGYSHVEDSHSMGHKTRDRGSRSGFDHRFDKRGSSEHGEWKHDMYDKLEKEEDNRPTSTT